MDAKTVTTTHDCTKQSHALAYMVTQNHASMKWKLHTIKCCEGAIEAAYNAGIEDAAKAMIRGHKENSVVAQSNALLIRNLKVAR